MLTTAKSAKGYGLESLDGKTARVKDFYFDEQQWAVRYLLAETGDWHARRQVLIPSRALRAVKNDARLIGVNLTPAQIEGSPAWAGVATGRTPSWRGSRSEEPPDFPFYSANEVRRHAVQAVDGEIGRIEDFIIDDEIWAIRYIVAQTRGWWPRRRILISPQWIERVNRAESNVFINLRRDTIQRFPECNEGFLNVPDSEAGLRNPRGARR